jgi:ATP/maltotriose-dependent transcriptional regulator MalT
MHFLDHAEYVVRVIHYVIQELLRYPPGNMHLCLITRRDPPLELATLFVQGRIEQLRMSELTFNLSEIIQLSAARLDKPPVGDPEHGLHRLQ